LRGALCRRLCLALALPAAVASPAATAGSLDPEPLAIALAELGPRPPGSAPHAQARALLLAALERAGMAEVEALAVAGAPGLRNLTGVLPGEGGGEIVLAAHYDTVRGSPGALDDAAGCATVLAAAADLVRTPRRHPVRVVLFDGEEVGLAGSRGWSPGGESALAALVVDWVGDGASRGATVTSFPVRRGGRRELAPGWLVHAALRGAESAGWPLAAFDGRLSLPVQLLLRTARPAFGADSDALLARGVPAVLLTDFSLLSPDLALHTPADEARRLDGERLRRWAVAVAAIARRLDGLDGRPVAEDEYLAVGGRVWLRRDLLWAGLLLWAPLVLRGRPGRWRGAGVEERRRGGRWYRAGFLFRGLLLVSLLAETALALALLFPAALLSLFPPVGPRRRWLWVGLGLLPSGGLLAAASWATLRGSLEGWELPWTSAILLAGALAAYAAACTRGPRPPELPAGDEASRPAT
jgi:hypothetical protein